jgi:type II secretory pathway pseudopilin PulG
MKPKLSLMLGSQLKPKSSSESGLTLIEALVSIIIATLALAAAAPPILLSAATQVQSRNAAQAQAIAQQELDRVRAILTREVGAGGASGDIPPVASTPLNTAAGPGSLTDQRSSLSATKALKIDADGDGDDDFFVQIIRDAGAEFASGPAQGELAVFQMGVRVYDIAAKDKLGSLKVQPASLQPSQGLSQRTTNPLAAVYTEVSRSDLKLSLDEYKNYLE